MQRQGGNTYSNRSKSYNERHDVRQHVEGVSHQSNGVGDVADDDLHQEERGGHRQHGQQTTRLPRVPRHVVIH